MNKILLFGYTLDVFLEKENFYDAYAKGNKLS